MTPTTPRSEDDTELEKEEEQESSSTSTSPATATTATTAATTTTTRNNSADWQAFSAHDIPSKGTKLPPLFFEALEKNQQKLNNILELGCGCGDLCQLLFSLESSTHDVAVGYKLFGTDINASAIEEATNQCPNGMFWVADVTQPDFCDNVRSTRRQIIKANKNNNDDDDDDDSRWFDFVVMQLLLSVVGGPNERRQVLQNASSLLQPGSSGTLYLSCSGVSDDINPTYQHLYQQDASLTGEAYSYYSRDDVSGDILYMTHHFTVDELKELLMQAGGFQEDQITIQQHKEASSRRPTEAAYFLYATATKSNINNRNNP
jgi:SAM-dependent methyltransferase